jgi:hypothetical protein
MSNSSTPTVPAGWYPDPAGSARSRWWDGAQWTEHFYDPATGVPVAQLTAPEGTKVYNVWIWLVVFLPYITLPFLFLIDFNGMFSNMDPSDPSGVLRAELQIFTSPGYVLLVVGGWIAFAGVVVSAYRDWRALQAAGVPRPFHWAWSFLNPVYAIGRAVVTKRRTGHGSAVLWATIGMIVFSFVISTVWASMFMVNMMQQLSTYSTLYN